ncbi:hypothetical protein B0H11DRAFT_2193552 [Mycena galericulata]|nr:hypothetical protein B0H11DRAFT_2193552 [Mycena galericulata]
MADRIPDEIISEILSPLLKHPDEVFSSTSEKPLLSPGYSSSTYLLVCKSWLRVSTPLLYNVVIFRTTAQAEALGKVLQTHPEFGRFIRKLRVEGGFGRVMHAILKCAPNITDLFVSLLIWGSDDSSGLCAGLPLINPRRIILFDGGHNRDAAKPKKNKQVTKLLDTIIDLIPKWDKLKMFKFPYRSDSDPDPVIAQRARAVASALAKSKSLQTLVVRATSRGLPEYMHQIADVPSLVSIHLTLSEDSDLRMNQRLRRAFLQRTLDELREKINLHPKLKALVTYESFDSIQSDGLAALVQDEFGDAVHSSYFVWLFGSLALATQKNDIDSADEILAKSAKDFRALEKLGDTSGSTLQRLSVVFPSPTGPGSRRRLPAESPVVLIRFTAVTHLWRSPDIFSFSKPPSGFSALSNLHGLCLCHCSPSILNVFSELSLDLLRDVTLGETLDVLASIKFLRRHGPKLLELTAPLEILAKVKVFDVCANVNKVVVKPPDVHSTRECREFPEDFMSCSTPNLALAKISFPFHFLDRQQESAMKDTFEALDVTQFPALKEIRVACIKWPTSEHEVRTNKWVPLSEQLLLEGIKLVGSAGVHWIPRA